MNKEILRVLLEKPAEYLRAWTWIYSRIDDSNKVQFSYEDLDLMGKVKVSDPVFKKILSTHLEWNRNKRYTTIELKEGTYTVIFYDQPLEMSEEEKNIITNKLAKRDDKKELKRKMTDDQIKLRKRCLRMYEFFYETRIGIKPPINAIQMKFLDQIIKYFQSTGKANSDERIMQAFEMIYTHWDTYPEGIKTKYMLNQISYNLPNILAHIKEQHSKSKLGKATEVGNKISSAIESGSMDKEIENLGKR